MSVKSVVKNVAGIRSAIQDMGRLRQILAILSKHGFGALVSRLKLTEAFGFRRIMRYGDAEQPVYKLPRRIRVALEELGPTFVKLGQILSTRSDILGRAIATELEGLQDNVPPMFWVDVEHQVQHALDTPIDRMFSAFSKEPLACASIAQVHRATLNTGEEVVVKVQRRAIRSTIDSDLNILHFLAERAATFVPELQLLDPVGVVHAFDQAIHRELDFSYERQSTERFQHNFKDMPGIGIPHVFPQACTSTMLTMEFIDGVKVTAAPEQLGADPSELARIMLRALFKMMFQDGLFHGDLHPGNILVRPTPSMAKEKSTHNTHYTAPRENEKDDENVECAHGAQYASGSENTQTKETLPFEIVLIDFGLTGRLLPRHRDNIIDLLISIGREDYQAIARIFFDIGVKQPGVRYDFGAFEADIVDLVDHHFAGRMLQDIELQAIVGDLLNTAIKYSIQLPPTYALVFKALMTVEGIGKTMAPRLNLIAEAKPFARQILMERYNPERLIREGFDTLVLGSSVFRELAQSTPRLLRDLETGRLSVQVESEHIAQNIADLKKTGQRLLRAVVSSAAVVSGTLAMDAGGLQILGLPALAFGCFVVAALVALPLLLPLLGRN